MQIKKVLEIVVRSHDKNAPYGVKSAKFIPSAKSYVNS